MKVEIVFAAPTHQVLKTVVVGDGATVADVITASGLARQFPDYDLDGLQAGVWGKLVDRARQVSENDRVEIFRPLEMDPREARRLKVGS